MFDNLQVVRIAFSVPSSAKYVNTVVPLYVATLTRGHPFYKATISENKLCIIVSNLPLTRGHPSNKARFSIPQGWPCKRGTTVLVMNLG